LKQAPPKCVLVEAIKIVVGRFVKILNLLNVFLIKSLFLFSIEVSQLNSHFVQKFGKLTSADKNFAKIFAYFFNTHKWQKILI
jgi:hypothetical protein